MYYYERIKNLRENADKTQKELALYLHIAQNTYSQYETGKRIVPYDILIKLARFYDCTTDYLLGVSDEPEHFKGHLQQKS